MAILIGPHWIIYVLMCLIAGLIGYFTPDWFRYKRFSREERRAHEEEAIRLVYQSREDAVRLRVQRDMDHVRAQAAAMVDEAWTDNPDSATWTVTEISEPGAPTQRSRKFNFTPEKKELPRRPYELPEGKERVKRTNL